MVQELSASDNNQLSQETSHKRQNIPQESNYSTDTVQVPSSNYVTERQKTIDWLLENKYPPLPVAPAIDPYKYHLISKEKKTGVKSCPLTSDLKPVPLYTGKNPSYLDLRGKPHLVNHRKYQKQLPTEQECNKWFANPLNGIGTLGGWNDTYWSDLDNKQFVSQSECDLAFNTLLERQPALRHSYLEKTQSGGYRIAVKCLNKPDFTNFALELGGTHVGELLGAGRFTVLAPTVGVNGNPYRSINRAVPVEVEQIDFIYPTKTPKPEKKVHSQVKNNQAKHSLRTTEWIPGSINLDLLLNPTARDILAGKNVKGDRSESLTTLINEAWGWFYWCQDNGINVTGTVEELAYHAGSQLGIDSERVERILQGINADASLQPAAQHLGGDESCWKKIYRLDKATFECKCPDHIKAHIKSSWNGFKKQNQNHHARANYLTPSSIQGDEHSSHNGFRSDEHSSTNGFKPNEHNSNNGFKSNEHSSTNGFKPNEHSSHNDSQPDDHKANWKEPQSYLGTIGYWVKVKGDNYEWQPRCNFDFTVERELTSESGGGFVLQVKPETEEKQYRVIITSSDLSSPDSFVDALKCALGFVVVCSLSKRELNALVAAKQAAYRQVRGGEKYRVCDRYGQQEDGLWVFENIQFRPDGTITNEHESLTVFDPKGGKEDFIPCPKLAKPNGIQGLDKLIQAGRKVFTGNVEQFLLTLGWVTAGIHFQTIQKVEGMFPLLDANGNPGSGKTLASEAALSLIGTNWAADGMVSKVSLSAIYELLSRTGSLPLIWDDPPTGKDSLELDEFCKAMWNAKPRRVRGNKQEPHSPIGFTSNHQLGGEQPAAYTRFARIFFDCKGNMNAIPELKEAQKIASGSFPELIKIGYDAEPVKKIMQSYLPLLTLANERIAWSLALITWYTEQLLRLVGNTDNIQQWVIDNLLASENDAENSGDSLTHFIHCLEALESKDLVGTWNKREHIEANGKKWMAIFATNAWAEVNKAFSPSTYNKKSLKAHILRAGGLVDKTVKFDASRDEVLDYHREMRRISSFPPGEEVEKQPPQPPRQKTRRAWMLPIELFTDEDDGGSNKPTPPPTSPNSGHNVTQNKPSSPSPQNVTSQSNYPQSDLSTQSFSGYKVAKNVTNQSEYPESDLSTQFPSGHKVTKNESPSQKNVTSQNDCPELDSSTQFTSGHKVTEKKEEKEKSDHSHFSHPPSIDFMAYQNRVMKCKNLMLACTNLSELTAFCSSTEFDNREIQWVWENLLTTDEKQKVNEAAFKKIKLPNLDSKNVTEAETISPTFLQRSQKNVTDCYFCDFVTELVQTQEKNSSLVNTFSNDDTYVTEKQATTEVESNQVDEKKKVNETTFLKIKLPNLDSKNVTSQSNCPESDLSTQNSSGHKVPQNVTSQCEYPESDLSTQNSSGYKVAQNVTNQSEYSESDLSTQNSSGHKVTKNELPSQKNVTSQNDCPEPDSSTQFPYLGNFKDNKL